MRPGRRAPNPVRLRRCELTVSLREQPERVYTVKLSQGDYALLEENVCYKVLREPGTAGYFTYCPLWGAYKKFTPDPGCAAATAPPKTALRDSQQVKIIRITEELFWIT